MMRRSKLRIVPGSFGDQVAPPGAAPMGGAAFRLYVSGGSSPPIALGLASVTPTASGVVASRRARLLRLAPWIPLVPRALL